jgi:hypothetical protein
VLNIAVSFLSTVFVGNIFRSAKYAYAVSYARDARRHTCRSSCSVHYCCLILAKIGMCNLRSRDRSVSIVTGVRAGRLGFDSRYGGIFLLDRIWGTPSLLSSGYRLSSLFFVGKAAGAWS